MSYSSSKMSISPATQYATPRHVFYRTVIADKTDWPNFNWPSAAYYLFGEHLTINDYGHPQAAPEAAGSEEERQQRLRFYEEKAKNSMIGRRFFITDQGYAGLAPKEAVVEDLVVVFLGDMSPSVLRRRASPSSVDFIGHCYVFGASHGEATRHIHPSRLLAKSPEAPLEDFMSF
jgi:hypothetical protein